MVCNHIRYPYDLDLVKAKHWRDYEKEKHIHFIVRFHLYIEEYQAEDTTYPGGILASFQTQNEVEIIKAIEKEHSVIQVDETICSNFVSEELVSGIQSDLTTSLETPLYTVSAKINANIQEKLQKTFSLSKKESATVTKRVTERFEVHQKIVDDGNRKFHAVACYKPNQIDVYLHYIDYLFAEYKTSMWGLRKKKRNLPRPEGNKHINRIKVNQPLFSLKYWELLPKSSLIYTNSQYQKETKKIKSPDKVSIEPLKGKIYFPLPSHPEKPTLYTLSNIAFPYRWIDREGDWTIEELKQLELDDAEGSGWWFRHGPGRK